MTERRAAYVTAQSIVGSSPGRPDDDFYPTPPEVTEALLSVEHWRPVTIWEPACGDGAIAKVLEAHGYPVYATDINYRGYGEQASIDFLNVSKPPASQMITNPPFKLAEDFVIHAKELGFDKFAMLAKLSFLEGQRRSRILE